MNKTFLFLNYIAQQNKVLEWAILIGILTGVVVCAVAIWVKMATEPIWSRLLPQRYWGYNPWVNRHDIATQVFAFGW